MRLMTTKEFSRYTTLDNAISEGQYHSVDPVEFTALHNLYTNMTKHCPLKIYLALHAIRLESGKRGTPSEDYEALKKTEVWSTWVVRFETVKFQTIEKEEKKEFPWETLYH